MLEKIINLKLFTIPNMVAIGAIVFFWGCVSFGFKSSLETSGE